MEIKWNAVLTGFAVAIVLGFVVSLLGDLTATSVFLLALPGLAGGFVAGYMVSGLADGAVHGGLATVVGALFLLAVLAVFGVLFVGLVPAIGGFTIGLVAILVQAIPGAAAGALGAWVKGRRAVRPATATPR